MRYLIISDIHSNLEALEAVLRASAARKCDGVIVLGDLVGYGADPNAVVDRIRGLKPIATVRGNHDKVAAGLENADGFNPMAKATADWTRTALSDKALEYLKTMPVGPVVVNDRLEICHGSPLDEDLYVVADLDAIRSIAASRRQLCMFGHTHVALRASVDGKKTLEIETPQGNPEFETDLLAGAKYMINPGSVGQPRDGDWRAAYCLYDTENNIVEHRRVKYDLQTAQRKLIKAGLPRLLADRLAIGR